MPGDTLTFPAALAAVVASTKGFMPDDEGLALLAAASSALADGGLAVEIGTYCGKSTIYLGHAASILGAHVVTVDHHHGSEENQIGWEYHDASLAGDDGRLETLPFLRRTLTSSGLEDVVTPIVGRSAVVASWWRSPIDFLFIDGGHTDAAASADYAGWSPWVRAGGVLAIHDVFPDPADGGQAPYRIYLAALESGEFAEVSVTGSLRVLRRVSAGVEAISSVQRGAL